MDPQFRQAVALVHAGRVGEAAALMERLGAAGSGIALETLGEMHWAGLLAQDPKRARQYFERAERAGHAPAGLRVTNLLASGVAGPRDWPAALARLAEEAKRDPARARAAQLIAAMDLDANGDPVAVPEPERLSGSPDVVRLPALFTAAECDYLLGVEAGGFAPAMVLDAARRAVRDPIRTSDQVTLNWLIEDPAIHALNRRLAAVSGTTPDQGEAAQILRYGPGQQYRAHFDYQPGAANQRAATALVYLNGDYAGGETLFLKTGLAVKGAKGDAIVFRNTLADGSRDPMAEHAGAPVTQGTKYLLSRWIRAERWAP